ncbi:MAG: hypothetical protein IPJ23_14600 [Ignavibacteriales bacterium]|nr:hypothetical protein [Ignavibacteriales bacterium]
MKKLSVLLLALTFIIACSKTEEKKVETTEQQTVTTQEAPAPVVNHRYGIKSGVVLYDAPMGLKQELYFDDYGAKEVFITMMDMGVAKTKAIEIRKDGYTYKYEDGKKDGTKSRWYTSETDFAKADPKTIERYKVKDLGTETIDGKECKKWSAEFNGTPMVTCIWNNVMVKSVTQFNGKDLVIEATKIQDTSVDPKLFELPAGVTFKDI